MAPAILGKEQKEQHEYLYWDYGHCRLEYLQAIRMGDWKGIRLKEDAPIQLYDLSKDLREEHDVAKANPDIVELLNNTMAKAVTPSPDYPVGVWYICEH